MFDIKALLDRLPQSGVVTWIGLRPERLALIKITNQVKAQVGKGLVGDRFSGHKHSKRQVTFFQYEHLAVIASFLGRDSIDPALLRRNIVVRGINLLALKDKKFQLGEAIFEMTGQCHPCSRMEEALGEGGYNAMRGHGGITARIVRSGLISIGDRLSII
jgi:MOSC domain-containing protein YiiM